METMQSILPRSRSRSPQKERKLPCTEKVPRHQLAPTAITLDYFDGFSGIGTPQMALTQTLAQLWDEGLRVHLRQVQPYEIDGDALRAARAIHVALPGVHFREPANAVNLPAHMDALIPQRAKIISIFEMVPCPIASWRSNIAHYFGQPIMTKTFDGTADRTREYYVSPAVDTAPLLQAKNTESLPPSIKWPAFPDVLGSPPTLRAIYPLLLRRQKLGTISSSDRTLLRKFMVLDLDEGRPRYAGPRELATWLDFPSTARAAMNAAFPCSHGSCGHEVLCPECSALATVLGRAWHLPTARHILRAVLRPHVLAASRGPSAKHIYLFTSGSPCTRISRGVFMEHSQDPTFRVGPHAPPSNLMWPWHEGITTLARKIHDKYGLTNAFLGHHVHRCGDVCRESTTMEEAQVLLRR